MGELKVVAMDMDGTLLTASQDILPYTRKVLMQLQKQGVSLLLASGRDIDSLQRIGEKLDLSHYPQSGYICLNGLEIYDATGNQLHQEKKLQYEDALVLARQAKLYHIDMILFFESCLYILEYGKSSIVQHHFTSSTKYQVNNVEDIPYQEFQDLRKVAFIQSAEVIEKVLPKIQEENKNHFDICKVEPEWVEINPYGLNKGTALQKYANIKNIPIQHIMAFGNGENDIEMLKIAGKGIAMGNSFENVKYVADDICEDNEHEGIGLYLQEYLKKQISE
ncbi:Cof-type HAD-IIB family hydrolase [Longibaculum muris]|uniref:Cof-type HAD-IIB family hydrolase n=1 Tax=Longibaculum muris TaxID=1796628 RepID=UPI003AB710EF